MNNLIKDAGFAFQSVVPPARSPDVEGVDPVAARFLRAAHVQRIVDNAARILNSLLPVMLPGNPLGPDTQLRSGPQSSLQRCGKPQWGETWGDWETGQRGKSLRQPVRRHKPLVIVGSHLLENRIGRLVMGMVCNCERHQDGGIKIQPHRINPLHVTRYSMPPKCWMRSSRSSPIAFTMSRSPCGTLGAREYANFH